MAFLFIAPPAVNQRATIHIPKSGIARQRLANQIGASTTLTPNQRATFTALGHDAVAAAIRACRSSNLERRDFFVNHMVKFAKISDTNAIYWTSGWLLDHNLGNPFEGRSSSELRHWLAKHGDPEVLARLKFARLKSTKAPLAVSDLSGFPANHQPEITDDLFAKLKDPHTDEYVRRDISVTLAKSEHPQALRWLLATRPTQRKRERPNPDLPSDKDRDGDGLSDNVDINPYAAPRKLSEPEAVMRIAIESYVHFLKEKGHSSPSNTQPERSPSKYSA